MDIVIDANVFKGFYQEEVLGMEVAQLEITASVLEVFRNDKFKIYVDDTVHIENEWRNVVDSEWFNAWYSDQIESLLINEITVNNHNDIIKSLSKIGFPVGGDKWYVRTAKSVQEMGTPTILLTEDIDFYDPTKKTAKGAARLKILKSKSSPVRKYLRKNVDIEVNSVEELLS
ncbi:hypothetical protein [Yersinia sp. 2541 StPb PI]|uniref:hypothetical protein n=1 Tax=Yersinia sp. 2541 StPb PI TaxID=3117407 RepID=UPI003FA4A69A